MIGFSRRSALRVGGASLLGLSFPQLLAAAEKSKAPKTLPWSVMASAVWMLNGPWNKAVFKEAADLVDAVSVHHYAQNWGSESDQGLLAVSSESDALMTGVKKQVDALGSKLGIKRRLAGERVAYEQLLHDQIDGAKSMATISTIAFAVGGVALARRASLRASS